MSKTEEIKFLYNKMRQDLAEDIPYQYWVIIEKWFKGQYEQPSKTSNDAWAKRAEK